MPKKDKRKTKPSSSGEDSILEEEGKVKHTDKKMKTDNIAQSHTTESVEPILSDLMASFDARYDAFVVLLSSDFQTDSLTKKHDVLESRVVQLEMQKD